MPRLAAPGLSIAEDVGEALFRLGDGFGVPVDGKDAVLRQGPHVVEAADMIGVGVGEEEGIEARYPRAQGLQTELGAGIHDDRGIARSDKDGGPVPPIARVARGADRAGAADDGYAEAGARTEKDYSHGGSIA